MKFKNFIDLFPPPHFLKVPYAGLSISDTSVRCIQFDKNSAGLYVKKYTERSIPPGVVVSGFINNTAELTEILRSVKKEFQVDTFKVSLPEEKAYLFTTKIPFVAPQEIRSTIEFSIEENVPLPVSELTFDYAIADEQGHGDHVDVIVSALPTQIIDTYIETLTGADISLLSLEIESQAMTRALVPVGETGTKLIVHFGKEKVGLYVAYKRIVHFTSTLPFNASAREDMSGLSQEIKRLYTYWHTLKDNLDNPLKHIGQIVLCGEDVTDELSSYFSSKHDTPTVLGNVWTNAIDIDVSVPPIIFKDSLRFSASIGLALPSHILI